MASGRGVGCLGVLALVVVVGGIGSLFGGGDDDADGDTSSTSKTSAPATPDPNDPDVIGDGIGAQVVCQDFVKDRLKSPSSADFSDEDARHVTGKVWQVTGAVDSDNAFGASIRNTYVCQARFVGDDNWRLVKLAGLSN